MKAISTMLLLLGLVAGPAYFFYCISFSGSQLDRVTVFSQDVSSFSAGGLTVQSSGENAQWSSPVVLELKPEMNPLTVQAIARYLQPAGARRKQAEYRVELAKGEETVWANTVSISARKEKKEEKTIKLGIANLPKTTLHIKTFSVDEAGPYTLDVRKGADDDLAVATLELAVRRNVLIPNRTTLIAGGMAFVLGIAGLIFSGRRRSQS